MNDLRLAVRMLRRNPGFTLAAVLTLAIGIGAATSVYGVVRAVLLEPLPYEEPGGLVTMDQIQVDNDDPVALSVPNFRDWQNRNRSFRHLGATSPRNLILTGRGPARVLRGRAVLGDFFEVLGARPALGRLIPGEETGLGSDHVAVLGHGLWVREFGEDPDVLGQFLALDGRPYMVVGVLPPRWGWLNPSQEVYLPMGTIPGLPWDGRDQAFGARAIARLLPGTTLEMAQRDLDRVNREIRDEDPQGAVVADVRPLQDFFVAGSRTGLLFLLGAVGTFLLIAVANVTNLLLARSEDRKSELAIRGALGAGRAHLLRPLLAESVVLSATAGLVGLGFAWLAVRGLLPVLPGTVPELLLDRVRIDRGVLVLSGGLTIGTMFIVGLVPGLRALRSMPASELRVRGHSSPGGERLRHGFVAMQVAASLVLLLGTGLMVRSFGALRAVEMGFDAHGILTARLILPDRYENEAEWVGLYDRLLAELDAIPGVEKPSASLLIPLSGENWSSRAAPFGESFEGLPPYSYLINVVSEDYFETLGVRILEGRGFTPDDRRGGALVAVVDEAMADRFWPGGSAVGQQVFLGDRAAVSDEDDPAWVPRTVVGVAESLRHNSLAEASLMQAHMPYRQSPGAGVGLGVLVRTLGPADAVAPSLRGVVADVDPDVAVAAIQPLEGYVDDDLGPTRALGRLLGAFSVVALLLALVGIAGVVAYSVRRRTRELGIRIALGADGRRILFQVLRGTLWAGGLGIAVGICASLTLSRLLGGLLYGVSPSDPPTYVALTFVLLIAATTAAALPALRAVRLDPTEVLRHE